MPKGRYGTSINWFTAMDPACDVMLAYEQNGERLAPDHGYPLRLIIPGYIGGRMIKWLNEISVTTEESDNFFHFNDNRVLPEHVTAEIANAEGWWYKPDYIINELNINSAIAYPGHLELVPLTGGSQKYTVQGYCYTGGGRKVIRVELSTDGGKTWTLTKLKRHEEPTEYGRYWCWVFWEWEIDLSTLFVQPNGAELLCRGWDAAMNRQPEAITWNVMGMMNNSYFRIKVHRCVTDAGKPALRFQHPTLAGPGNFGGWFEEKALGAADAAAAAMPPPPPPPKASDASVKTFTMDEVAKHTGKDDVWFVVKNKVYDATRFLDDHPGGGSSILIVGGQDCTEEFEALHSSKAWKMLDEFYLGDAAAAQGRAGRRREDFHDGRGRQAHRQGRRLVRRQQQGVQRHQVPRRPPGRWLVDPHRGRAGLHRGVRGAPLVQGVEAARRLLHRRARQLHRQDRLDGRGGRELGEPLRGARVLYFVLA